MIRITSYNVCYTKLLRRPRDPATDLLLEEQVEADEKDTGAVAGETPGLLDREHRLAAARAPVGLLRRSVVPPAKRNPARRPARPLRPVVGPLAKRLRRELLGPVVVTKAASIDLKTIFRFDPFELSSGSVITSYSIHYTKLYEPTASARATSSTARGSAASSR